MLLPSLTKSPQAAACPGGHSSPLAGDGTVFEEQLFPPSTFVLEAPRGQVQAGEVTQQQAAARVSRLLTYGSSALF